MSKIYFSIASVAFAISFVSASPYYLRTSAPRPVNCLTDVGYSGWSSCFYDTDPKTGENTVIRIKRRLNLHAHPGGATSSCPIVIRETCQINQVLPPPPNPEKPPRHSNLIFLPDREVAFVQRPTTPEPEKKRKRKGSRKSGSSGSSGSSSGSSGSSGSSSGSSGSDSSGSSGSSSSGSSSSGSSGSDSD